MKYPGLLVAWTINYLVLRHRYVSWGRHGRRDPQRWYLEPDFPGDYVEFLDQCRAEYRAMLTVSDSWLWAPKRVLGGLLMGLVALGLLALLGNCACGAVP